MDNTNSINFPEMIDVARNCASVATDAASIVNRVKLMMLTEPTELHMNAQYGLGLKRYLFQYNNENTIAIIRDKLVEQLRLWEPCVIPEETKVESGLLFTEKDHPKTAMQEANHLKLTVILITKYGDTLQLEF